MTDENEPQPSEINTNTRLFDLVRFMRSELHDAGLINDNEYFWLCSDAPMAQKGPVVHHPGGWRITTRSRSRWIACGQPSRWRYRS